jgi:uncharacterized protein
VNQSRHPFHINVGFLFNQPIGYIREIPFEFQKVTISEEFIFNNFEGIAAFHRTQNGLRLLGSFKADVKTTCVRCLDEFDLAVQTDFEEMFTFPNHPLSENEAFIPENGVLDLEEMIGDFLMLEVPINPVCRKDCQGLCKECGQNLNLAACLHHPRVSAGTELPNKAGSNKRSFAQ